MSDVAGEQAYRQLAEQHCGGDGGVARQASGPLVAAVFAKSVSRA